MQSLSSLSGTVAFPDGAFFTRYRQDALSGEPDWVSGRRRVRTWGVGLASPMAGDGPAGVQQRAELWLTVAYPNERPRSGIL
jgi:hypothetical protein